MAELEARLNQLTVERDQLSVRAATLQQCLAQRQATASEHQQQEPVDPSGDGSGDGTGGSPKSVRLVAVPTQIFPACWTLCESKVGDGDHQPCQSSVPAMVAADVWCRRPARRGTRHRRAAATAAAAAVRRLRSSSCAMICPPAGRSSRGGTRCVSSCCCTHLTASWLSLPRTASYRVFDFSLFDPFNKEQSGKLPRCLFIGRHPGARAAACTRADG